MRLRCLLVLIVRVVQAVVSREGRQHWVRAATRHGDRSDARQRRAAGPPAFVPLFDRARLPVSPFLRGPSLSKKGTVG